MSISLWFKGNENIALNKPASQSRFFIQLGKSSSAVDGYIDDEDVYTSNMYQQSTNPWWMVDLQDVYFIEAVKIFGQIVGEWQYSGWRALETNPKWWLRDSTERISQDQIEPFAFRSSMLEISSNTWHTIGYWKVLIAELWTMLLAHEEQKWWCRSKWSFQSERGCVYVIKKTLFVFLAGSSSRKICD